MYFHNWLKRNSNTNGYIHRNTVLEYVCKKSETHHIAEQVMKELHNSPDVKIIHIDVWQNDWYNFKG